MLRGTGLTTTKDEAEKVLAGVEANLGAELYRSRWDTARAREVVPRLIACLKVDDTLIVHRALLALGRIGPEAQQAIDMVVGLVAHSEAVLREVAILTLAGIGLRTPERVIEPLVQSALRADTQKPALFALINLWAGAASAVHVFVAAFDRRDAHIRRLALRGLGVIGASVGTMQPLLARARTDRNGQVRAAAAKLGRE